MEHENSPRTAQDCRDNGHVPMAGADLRTWFETVSAVEGLYLYPFRFTGRISADGSLTGRNNFGTEDTGRWQVGGDLLQLVWDRRWDHTVTQAYRIGEILHFFDAYTGNWRMSLKRA